MDRTDTETARQQENIMEKLPALLREMDESDAVTDIDCQPGTVSEAKSIARSVLLGLWRERETGEENLGYGMADLIRAVLHLSESD